MADRKNISPRTTQQVKERIRKARSRVQQRVDGQVTRQRILTFLRTRVAQGNFLPPTLREIMAETNISSTSVASYHLGILESLGEISRTPNVSRGIQVTGSTMELGNDHLFAGLEVPPTDALLQGFLIDTRLELLQYFEQIGEDGRRRHWEVRTQNYDELPNLARAVALDAAKRVEMARRAA